MSARMRAYVCGVRTIWVVHNYVYLAGISDIPC